MVVAEGEGVLGVPTVGVTVTEPLKLADTHPVTLLDTLKTDGEMVPATAGELRFTVIGDEVNVPLETAVIPVPEIENKFAPPVVAV